MAHVDRNLLASERRRLRWTLLIYLALILGATLLSRTERGLFSFPLPKSASAFSAVPNGETDAATEAGLQGIFATGANAGSGNALYSGPRRPRSGVRRGGPAGGAGTPPLPAGEGPGDGDGDLPSTVTNLADLGNGNTPGTDTGTPGTTPGTTPGGGPPTFGSGVTIPIPAGSTAAVPEPGTWLLLIFGFLGVGSLMRRRNALKLATSPARNTKTG